MRFTKLKTLLTRVIRPSLLAEMHCEGQALVVNVANYLFPWRRANLARSRKLRGLMLNIGCGPFNPEGWYSVDLISAADLQIDIRHGLPLADCSCRLIFSEHTFEHLELQDLHTVLAECARVLEIGGAIRIVVPNLARYVQAYCENDLDFIHATWPQDVSPTHLLNGVFYVTSHRFIHDFASMSKELYAAGFSDVYRSAYRESRFSELNIDSDMLHRRSESLYVEAIKR